MKKILYIGLTGLVFAFGFTTIQTPDNCDKKALSASCKKKLEPFKYDSQKFTRINFTAKAQQLEVEVPVFVGEKYRLVFNTSSIPKPIKISVFTKDKDTQKRDAIYTSKNVKADETEFIFDAPRVRKMFIDYDVPADTTKASGCVIFMVGYK